jgi:hypothetical protein
MKRVLPSYRLLYLLAAILLGMQSFAIWHDTTHPFHHVSQECSKFEAISKSPTADLATSPQLLTLFSVASIKHIDATPLLRQHLQTTPPIRAPPKYS